MTTNYIMFKYPITIDITLPKTGALLAFLGSYYHFNKTVPEAVIYSESMEGRTPVSYRNKQIVFLTSICTLAGLGAGYMIDKFVHIPQVNLAIINGYEKFINWAHKLYNHYT